MKRNLLLPLAIFFVVSVIFAANFSPNLWLSGWDNLHPEFSFNLNIKRSLFAVWQEYQGLGLLGGMGHASDLPRQIVLYLSSFVLPENWLRQLYVFMMLLLGPLGVYFLIEKLILKQRLAGLAGALFYLLNLATIQTVYTSFEPFVTHFGLLPWLILTVFRYLKSPTFKNLIFFIAVNLFAVPQAYVPTVFLVYIVVLTGSLLIFSLQHRGKVIGRAIQVFLLTLLINAFWLLPFVYFVLTQASVTQEAKINQMTTENVFLLNKEFGNITDVAILKGFWFDYRDFSHDTRRFDNLMTPWKNHLDNVFITGIGLLLFVIVLIGVIAAFKQKNQYRFILLFLFLFSFVVLANNTAPFSWVDNLLHRLPLVSQALRSPFTKFATFEAFAYSIFFACAIGLLLTKLRGWFNKTVLFAIVVLLLIVFTFPAFTGNLFYQQISGNIPKEYFKVWEFFGNQDPNTRIAHFPIPTIWGWNFYQWGYSGSGFLWYGLNQPIIDRAFDVWSRANENYYWEISYALYSKNKELFEKVLEKYQISWLLLDGNIIYPSSPKALYIYEIEQLIQESNKIELAKEFGGVKIYKVDLKAPVNNFVFLAYDLPILGPQYKWNNFDQIYLENGNYISYEENFSIYYPFRSLFTGRSQKELEFVVEDKNDYFIFRDSLPEGLGNYFLEIPKINDGDLLWVDPNDLSRVKSLYQDVYFDGKSVEVQIPKTGGLFSAEIEAKDEREFKLLNLPHKVAYLITVESRNIEGKPLNFWIENLNARRADLETYLPYKSGISYFIQPPMEEDGLGYALHFDEIKFGNEKSINELGKIKVYPIPFNFLTSLKLKKENFRNRANLRMVEVEHPNPSFYSVKLPQGQTLKNQVLILSQAFENGWKAYEGVPIFGKEIKTHVLVNNWANGWAIDSKAVDEDKKVVLIFIPQYLEFLGLFLAILTIVVLLVSAKIYGRSNYHNSSP